ncbi:hypothetical protein [Treponema sp. R6D11]
MKKISRIIAMILVLVMLACSFTSCLSWWLITGEPLNLDGAGDGAIIFIFLPVIDVVLLPITLTVFIVRKGIEAARNNRGKKWDGIDTFSATVKTLPNAEFNSIIQKFDYLPESEIDDLAYKFYSLPESELDAYSQTLNAFSEEEIAAMTEAINYLPKGKFISLMETLNSMSEEKLISTMKRLQLVKYRYQNRRVEQ